MKSGPERTLGFNWEVNVMGKTGVLMSTGRWWVQVSFRNKRK